ncbi:MAG: class I SAM-dependent methyltransferase [Planctomycetota bacterium]
MTDITTRETQPLAELFSQSGHIVCRFQDRVVELGGGSPRIEVKINTHRALLALLSKRELPITEFIVAGEIELAYERPEDILVLLNFRTQMDTRLGLAQRVSGWMVKLGSYLLGSARLNARWLRNHYSERADQVICSFLDREHQLYSHGVGFGPSDEVSLEEAAGNKLRWICDTCELGPGARVLDVGGGWGSFLRFAGQRGARVHSITVTADSARHLEATRRQAGLEDCEVEQIDFWDLPAHSGPYDAIVCLGTIEHLPHYERLLQRAQALLRPGGWLHTDGFSVPRRNYYRHPFMHKYVFPGDNTPLLLDAYVSALERTPFVLEHLINDAYEYYRTILAWSYNFEAQVEALAAAGVDQQLLRIFRLYLWGITNTFRLRSIGAYRVVARAPSESLRFATFGPAGERRTSSDPQVGAG